MAQVSLSTDTRSRLLPAVVRLSGGFYTLMDTNYQSVKNLTLPAETGGMRSAQETLSALFTPPDSIFQR